jgi:hypothetical protein
MAERIVLELPDELAKSARAIAARRDRRVEQVLVEWIDQAVAERRKVLFRNTNAARGGLCFQ